MSEQRLTLQEVLDNTWNWHIRDRSPRGFCDGGYVYRGQDGRRCGIGVSIPDSLLPVEEVSISELVNKNPAISDLFLGIKVDALFDLQAAHDDADSSCFCADYERRLRNFAAQHDLAIPGVPKEEAHG